MKLIVGEKKTLSKTIHQEDVMKFIELSGDDNPIHYDEEYAKNTVFGKRIAHGMLVASYISAAIGANYNGAIYMGQNLSFRKPVYLEDTVTVIIEVNEVIREDKGIYGLKTTVINQNDEAVIEGNATIKYQKESN
ncbi:MAG: MaoC family dehydratase [Pseudobutyrivibrio sp.]|nr:MaoC family dehydratase [Pseudobutyrivibrio sp.]MCF0186099.1 MaoC family dehydratase [Bacteroidaceae bacterium]